MHIEPGLVEAGKLGLGYATAAGAVTGVLATAFAAVRERGVFGG